MLTPGRLLTASAQREVRLPAAGCTPTEAAYIGERGVLLGFTSTTDAQRARKTANVDWLVRRRKQLFGLARDSGWNVSNRRDRYHALSIATSHGTAYEVWKATHDPRTGAPLPTASGSSRARALAWLADRTGITEQPRNSNTDNRADGIRAAQVACAGGGQGLVGQPWCGVWCWRALQRAGVPKIDTWWMASVATIEQKARRGERCYRGWRSGFDTRGVLPGDQVVIGGSGVHVETVVEVLSDSVITHGGNTSSGISGSQSNGGGAFRRRRYRTEITGFALVDHVVDIETPIDEPSVPPFDDPTIPPFDDPTMPPVVPTPLDELSPEELAEKLAAEAELATELSPEDQLMLAPHPSVGAAIDDRFAPSDDLLSDELLDRIAAEEEAALEADAAEDALVEQHEAVEDPPDGIFFENDLPPSPV
ncbi:MAG: hypothetical protein Q8O56_08935 [Solirubrobacteraceae bacterium]|nr:hypothetical protein [Solirubrobacteraceae bacterium]